MCKKKVVLFGTGEDLPKCLGILREYGIEPYCLTDNNPSKWGTMLEGKKIIAPQDAAQMDCQIVITTSYYKKQIQNQLNELGVGDRILDYDSIFRKYIDKKSAEYQMNKVVIRERECILVDAYMGNGWDGDAQYACVIASCLKKRGYDIHVFAKDSLIHYSDETEELIERFQQKKEAYWDTVLPIIEFMEQRLPFVLIANSLDYVMAAAYVLEQKCPDKIKIISVIHNDNYSMYQKNNMWRDSLDKIVCISKKIRETLEKEWQLPKEKLYYKVNPVLWEETDEKELDVEHRFDGRNDSIKIGWGGRLYSSQKRANLLPILIEALESKKINYYLEIAGDGPCYAMIEEYIQQKGLKERVHLLGRLEPGSMRGFWMRQQVYINVSEWEGCCLAMLEAMRCGAVPVVTEVSGTEEVVYDGRSGFKVGTGEVERIADKIAYLAANTEEWERMSNQAKCLVKEMCGLDQYVDFIEGLIQ